MYAALMCSDKGPNDQSSRIETFWLDVIVQFRLRLLFALVFLLLVGVGLFDADPGPWELWVLVGVWCLVEVGLCIARMRQSSEPPNHSE